MVGDGCCRYDQSGSDGVGGEPLGKCDLVSSSEPSYEVAISSRKLLSGGEVDLCCSELEVCGDPGVDVKWNGVRSLSVDLNSWNSVQHVTIWMSIRFIVVAVMSQGRELVVVRSRASSESKL